METGEKMKNDIAGNISLPLSRILLLCIMTLPVQDSLLAQQSGPEWDRLQENEILVGKTSDGEGLPGLRAMFLISATREELWAMLTDYNNFGRIYSGIDSLRVLHEDNAGARVEFYQSTFLKRINYILYRKYDREGYRLSWERESGDLEIIRGSWEIHETPEQDLKLVVYTSYFRYGGIVPSRLTRRWAMKEVRSMAENARAWIALGE